MSGEQWIDVSAHQGVIDWPRVAASGVKGVIIRAGYGNDVSQTDTQFAANIKGAVAAGLKIGVYWFGYPDSVQDARAEWASCKKVIEPYRSSILFAAYDYEYDSVSYYKRIHGAGPGNTFINQMVVAFLVAAKADGWRTALYTNNDYRLHVFSAATLAAADYLWLADYSGGPDVSCAIQQTGSNGTVPGISGSVDMDTVFVAIGAMVFTCDTTTDVEIPSGGCYTAMTTGDVELVAGTDGIVQIVPCLQAGYTLWHIVPLGKSGQTVGIYLHGRPEKLFTIQIK